MAAEIRALPSARALQGQGREIRRRIHLPQGRQEEVTEHDDGQVQDATERRKARVRRAVKARRRRPRRGCRCSARRSTSTRRSSTTLKGETLAAASSMERRCATSCKTGANVDAAKAVGKLIAERAAEKGVKDVVFDRGSYLYHGRVKALAEAAREGGLKF